MGEVAQPSAADRVKQQKIAAAIVESVRNDEKMPLPLKAIGIQYKGLFYDVVEVEDFIFFLAQEITILMTERKADVQLGRVP